METQSGSPETRSFVTSLIFALVLILPGVSIAHIEEVIVTAQKRSQSSQDVGIALTAFSDDSLQNNAITQPRDLFQRVPNTTVASNSSGVPPVLIFQDEVVLGSPTTGGAVNFNSRKPEIGNVIVFAADPTTHGVTFAVKS